MTKAARRVLRAAAAILDAHLKGRDYVCGARVSLADFALGSALILEEQAQLPLADFANIQSWAAKLKALPAWRATLAQQVQPAASSVGAPELAAR